MFRVNSKQLSSISSSAHKAIVESCINTQLKDSTDLFSLPIRRGIDNAITDRDTMQVKSFTALYRFATGFGSLSQATKPLTQYMRSSKRCSLFTETAIGIYSRRKLTKADSIATARMCLCVRLHHAKRTPHLAVRFHGRHSINRTKIRLLQLIISQQRQTPCLVPPFLCSAEEKRRQIHNRRRSVTSDVIRLRKNKLSENGCHAREHCTVSAVYT